MTVWAGAEPPLEKPRRRRRSGFVREEDQISVPRHYSVHAVSDETGLSACAEQPADGLIRVDRPWEQWLPLYKCRECHRRVPTT